MKNIYVLIITLLFVVSCVNTITTIKDNSNLASKDNITPPMLDGAFFGEKIEVLTVEEVFGLTDDQKDHFVDLFTKQIKRNVPAFQRITKYLEDRLDQFNFYSDTYTASDALTENQGNCLSLAILTKSLADLANIDIGYQLIETEPVYQKAGNIVVSSQHIRTVLIEPATMNKRLFNLPGLTYIDYFPTANSRVLRTVDEAEFFSMYYSNKATEAMFKNDFNLAYWLTKKALELKPDDSNAINIMAVIHSNVGYDDYAEKLYLFGLSTFNKNKNQKQKQQELDLLNNYHSLLTSLNRLDDAEQIAKRIGYHKEVNPFKWISLGNDAYNERDYTKAISYFRRAKKMAPYLHETYAGLSRAQFQLGKLDSASKSLDKALENSHKNSIRTMYQHKIDMLNNIINDGDVAIKATAKQKERD